MGTRRHIHRLALAVAVAALLTGCGAEDEEADVREAAAEFFIAVAESSPEACELSSEAERKRIELTAKLEVEEEGAEEPTCEQLVRDNEALEESTSALLRQAEEIDDASVEVDERFAVLSFDEPTPAPVGPTTLLLVREQGSWKVDDAR